MTRIQRSALSAFVLAGPSGCVAPMLHPLRATDGPLVEIASTLNIDAGRRGRCDEGGTGCGDVEEHHVSLDELELSVGYAHVIARRWGIMGGVYAPAPREYLTPAALWSFFTVQNEFASAGAGPEVGLGGGGMTIGGELGPWGDLAHAPHFGVYGRWFWPFAPEPNRLGGAARSWQVGGRLRFGPIYLGYAFDTVPNGVLASSDETRYAQSHHLITLGLTLDHDTEKAFTQIGR